MTRQRRKNNTYIHIYTHIQQQMDLPHLVFKIWTCLIIFDEVSTWHNEHMYLSMTTIHVCDIFLIYFNVTVNSTNPIFWNQIQATFHMWSEVRYTSDVVFHPAFTSLEWVRPVFIYTCGSLKGCSLLASQKEGPWFDSLPGGLSAWRQLESGPVLPQLFAGTNRRW